MKVHATPEAMSTSEPQIVTLCRQMMAHYQRGQFAEAVAAGESAWPGATALWGERDLRVAEISHNLGELYRLQVRFADAVVAARRAIEVREALLGTDDPLLANTLETIAKIQEETEDLAAAVDGA